MIVQKKKRWKKAEKIKGVWREMKARDDRETQTDIEERARRRGAREDNTLGCLKGQATGVTSFFFLGLTLCLLVSRPGG